jgi:hypothetical protein
VSRAIGYPRSRTARRWTRRRIEGLGLSLPARLRGESAPARVEEVGVKLRDMMPWIKKGALVDKTKN